MAVRGVADPGTENILVTSVTGTVNQITASPTTGAVVVGLASIAQIPTSLAIGGATIGANALAVTGAGAISGALVVSGLLTGTGVTVASGQVLKLGNAATTGLAAGVLAALTNATIIISDSSGQAYRIPCII